MQSAEIELKFPIADLAHLQSLLPGLGFLLDTPRTFEHNTLYDTPARALRESRQLLRIRRYGDLWTLTHKRIPPQSPDSDPSATARYKVRIETETQLSEGPALGAIFEQLGYSPVFRYEKFRTEWSQVTSVIEGPLFTGLLLSGLPTPSPRCHLVIDETPIGDYAELEGPPAWIDETLAKLGVDPDTCLTQSYGKLFLAWKGRTLSSAENLTFDEISAAAADSLQPSLR
ncbi:MAG: class IV adenylate cyclase [Acidobacteriota bacterium]|nr:class IV adenylate cyclase [Acidobacteriota bacterium]